MDFESSASESLIYSLLALRQETVLLRTVLSDFALKLSHLSLLPKTWLLTKPLVLGVEPFQHVVQQAMDPLEQIVVHAE